MRGKAGLGFSDGLPPRIIPAYAGKSRPLDCSPLDTWDHPRVCGEKAWVFRPFLAYWGSPPRVRGKGERIRSGTLAQGITPARAGKRWAKRPQSTSSRDHPRVCGEKVHHRHRQRPYLGSPPRMRGKVKPVLWAARVAGITPACAGKSSIQHLTASLGEFEVQKGHPVFHLRQRLQVWPDHARHLRHGLILHASRSAGQGRRLCPGPCPDTAGSGTPRDPSPAKRPHTSPPAATPGGCRAWQSGATAPGSR